MVWAPVVLISLAHVTAKPVVTVSVTLLAASKTPTPQSIAPYRNALVSGDYKVVKILDGKAPGVKVGGTIRALRWGILHGKPTGLSKLKRGATVRIKIRPLEGWPEMEREYQVEELPVGNSTTYFVEVK